MVEHTGGASADGPCKMGDTDDGPTRQLRVPDPALPRLLVDFNRLDRRADGVEVIDVGCVDDAQLHGRGLFDGMTVVLEEPGELQMTGVLRRRTGPVCDYWQGELDPHSLVYHVRVAEQSLYFAGPEGCARYEEYYARPADEEIPEAMTQGGAGEGEAREARWDLRPQPPAAALTLGVEGTFEQWYRALAGTIPSGETVLAANGEPIVLVDDQREVDARVRVLRLPPEPSADSPAANRTAGTPSLTFPQGRRVWLAEPDWSTLRRIPWPRHPADEAAPAEEVSAKEASAEPGEQA